MAKKHKRVKKRRPPLAASIDKHLLYEEAVQEVDFDISFFERTYKKYRGRPFHRLREDFCGTGALAASFVAKNRKNRAWGVDFHKPTLAWGLRHHISYLDPAVQKQVHLVEGNVLTAETPAADVTVAFNFSYWVFKTREQVLSYFRKVHRDLAPDGIFFCDAFGGQHAMGHKKDRRKISKVTRPDGLKLPKYTYIWDQERFNAITHEIKCHIHFRFADGSRLDKAFTYDWRLWTLPELRELLSEAGFSQVEVYLHGWEDDGESDEVYRRRTFYKNELSWVGYLAALK